jgi:signal transduction histidine kinase
MNWTNLLWLGLGFGFGLASRWLWPRSARKTPPALEPLPLESLSNKAEPKNLQIAERLDLQDVQQNQLTHLKQQLEDLQLACRMATEISQFKGGFLARTSHELRSPLNGLIGMHQLILSDLCDSPEEEREFIAQANTSAISMVNALDRILEVARVEHGTVQLDIQPIQLAQIFQEVHDLTHLQARNRNLQLQIPLPDPEIYILADPTRFRQVLVHFVDAAISRMPEDPITVTAKPDLGSRRVHIWVNDHCPADARSEPVNLLNSDLPTNAVIPSQGLNLLSAQILLKSMQGNVEVIPTSSTADRANSEIPDKNTATRLQILIPLAKE